jgi:LPXTG-site transpeptidase (sortase) family protein
LSTESDLEGGFTMSVKMQKTLMVISAAILMLGGLGVALYPMFTDARYVFEQWQMGASAAQADPADAGGIPLPKGSVARIEIPAIGVEAYVVEGTGAKQLDQGPGHYPKTPLPGEHGNASIAGHRTMHGHVFHDLNRLKAGDEIRTATAAQRATYRVVEIRVVDDSDVGVAAPTSDDRLTLTTCHPIGSARQRLVVIAKKTS